MALARVLIPTPTAPAGTGDYVAILAQLEAERQSFTLALGWFGTLIKSGRVFNIGGVLYKSTSDTTISGTQSKYIKIIPAGATATAVFVAALTGVTWNHEYGGYYDGSGNLYIFDESQAAYDGVISGPKTAIGAIAYIRDLTALNISASVVSASNVNATTLNSDEINADIVRADIGISADFVGMAGIPPSGLRGFGAGYNPNSVGDDSLMVGSGAATGEKTVAVGRGATFYNNQSFFGNEFGNIFILPDTLTKNEFFGTATYPGYLSSVSFRFPCIYQNTKSSLPHFGQIYRVDASNLQILDEAGSVIETITNGDSSPMVNGVVFFKVCT